MKNEQSPSLSLNKLDWGKIGIGAGVAMGGALLTYLTDLIPTIDFGVWTPIVMTFWSVALNILRKWLQGPSQ